MNAFSSQREAPPEVEWWDEPILGSTSYDAVLEGTDKIEDPTGPITFYVQHPVQIQPPWEKKKVEPQALKLTKRVRLPPCLGTGWVALLTDYGTFSRAGGEEDEEATSYGRAPRPPGSSPHGSHPARRPQRYMLRSLASYICTFPDPDSTSCLTSSVAQEPHEGPRQRRHPRSHAGRGQGPTSGRESAAGP